MKPTPQKMYPKCTQMVPKALQGPTAAAQSDPQGSPRSSQGARRAPQGIPRGTQKSSKMVPGAPKETPKKRKVKNARGSSENPPHEGKCQYSHEKTSSQKFTFFDILAGRRSRSSLALILGVQERPNRNPPASNGTRSGTTLSPLGLPPLLVDDK